MRISSVMTANVAATSKYSVKTNTIKDNKVSLRDSEITLIAFTGNDALHDVLHGVSVSVEDNLIGLGMYKCGGQGSVAAQLPDALEKSGMRMPHFVPYYCYNNPKGEMKVLVIPKEYDLKKLPQKMPENLFVSYPEGKSLEEIAKELNLPTERVKFVVQDVPESVKDAKKIKDPITGVTKELKYSPYRILIPTDVKGSIQRIDENNLGSIKSIPYRAYKMALPTQDGYNIDKVICIHTPDFAKFEKAYTYSPEVKDHPHLNLFTRDFCDAVVDSLPKYNTKEFNYLKPANLIAHCRTGFSVTESLINRSQSDEYFRGFNIVDIFHNPMPDYQGVVGNPLDFLRYKATTDDWVKLSRLPEFSQLISADSHRYNMSEEESAIVDKIIRPFLQYYVDDNGNYNQSITPLIARERNPKNVFPNHVSHTFANEVIEYDDIARGLTSFFRAANERGDKIPGRPNGCNIDFMRINDPKANMGNNGLSADLSWYHPYDPKIDSAEKIVAAKRKNTEGFLNAIGKATEQRLDKLGNFTNASVDDALNQLMFSKDQIKKNKYVLGGLSPFHEKDILWGSWGRSDPQKGFPILLEGFRKYLLDETVPLEIRQHSKLAIGSGSDPWPMEDNGVGDFHKIKDIMHKIQTMEDGKFAQNVMYSNGGISNRLVTGMTYTMFSSTGEPQGLTTPESLQSGTPSGSLHEGGAGEMIVTREENPQKANGFRTKHGYMRNLSDIEKQKGIKIPREKITEYRFDASSDEIAQLFKDMALTYHNEPEVYKNMVLNAARSEFDWHNNGALNNGRSTIQLYREDAFKIPEGWDGRNKSPLNRLVKEFDKIFGKESKPTIEPAFEKLTLVIEKLISALEKNSLATESNTGTTNRLAELTQELKNALKSESAEKTVKESSENQEKTAKESVKETINTAKETVENTAKQTIKNEAEKATETAKNETVEVAENTAKKLKGNKWTKIAFAAAALAAGGLLYVQNRKAKQKKNTANQQIGFEGTNIDKNKTTNLLNRVA